MTSVYQYENTKKAVGELEELLSCRICNMMLNDPCTLQSCQHFFCRDCAEDYAGNVCPICNIPSHMKDLSVNRNMKNIVKLVKYLNKLLYDGEQAVMSESESASGVNANGLDADGDSDRTDDMDIDADDGGCRDNEDDEQREKRDPKLPAKPAIEVDPSSVYDFIESPQTSTLKSKPASKKKGGVPKAGRTSSNPPRASRSKSKKEKKTKRLQDINDSWGVGTATLTKCDSCKSKKGVRKTVRVVTPHSQEDLKTSGVEDEDVHDLCEVEEIQSGTKVADDGDGSVCSLDVIDGDDVDCSVTVCSKNQTEHNMSDSYISLERIDGTNPEHDDCHSSKVDRNIMENGVKHSRDELSGTPKTLTETYDKNTSPKDVDQKKRKTNKRQSQESADKVEPVKKGRRSSAMDESAVTIRTQEDNTADEGSTAECMTTPVSSKKSARRSAQKKVIKLDASPLMVDKKTTRKSVGPDLNVSVDGFLSPVATVKRSRKLVGSDHGSPAGKGIVTPVRKTSTRLSTSSPASHLQKKNSRGETQLHVAAIKGDLEKVQTLLKEGAIPDTKDNAGWTPLHEASNHGFTEIVCALLDHGAFINAPGMDNDSPLLDAVQNYRLETVKLLVARGADKSLRNSSGQTPMDCALTPEMKDALFTPVVQVDVPVSLPSTPSSVTKSERVVLLCTGLKRQQQSLVQKCASMLHGRIVLDFSPEVTHVITSVNDQGQCTRTLKYLNAVLLGKWILNFQWIEECLHYKDRVCEEAFEVPGSSIHPNLTTPLKGRQNLEKQLPGLFDGCQIYFTGNFHPPTPAKKELVQLAKSGGATVLNREPKLENVNPNDITVPYHAKTGTYLADCCYFIIHDPKDKLIKTQRHFRVCTASATWFMDCISKFELLALPEIDSN